MPLIFYEAYSHCAPWPVQWTAFIPATFGGLRSLPRSTLLSGTFYGLSSTWWARKTPWMDSKEGQVARDYGLIWFITAWGEVGECKTEPEVEEGLLQNAHRFIKTDFSLGVYVVPGKVLSFWNVLVFAWISDRYWTYWSAKKNTLLK